MAEKPQNITLDCGIAYARIEAWLASELGLACETDGRWTFETDDATCAVALQPLPPRTVGAVSLERTQLVVSGNNAAAEAFMKLFTLRFVSAGG